MRKQKSRKRKGQVRQVREMGLRVVIGRAELL